MEKHTTKKNPIQEFWWAEKMYKARTWMEEKVRPSEGKKAQKKISRRVD